YFYDDGVPTIQADKGQSQVKKQDRSNKAETRALYSSLPGPILPSILGLPIFPWTATNAYAMGDVNATNFRYLNHFFKVDTAQSVKQLDRIERKYQGIPWVNTIATDHTGQAYYADIGSIPNVPDAKVDQCLAPGLGTGVYAAVPGLPILDGSKSSCRWN